MELSVFNFNGAAVRTVSIDGAPWWVLKDACAILGIRNSRDAAARLDDDEKGVAKTDTLGGGQDLVIVSEAGLYSLIGRSNKPEAKAFMRWVRHEVLPAIRTTGGYQIAPRDAVSEVDRLAGMMGQFLPAIAGKVADMDTRIAKVEEVQRITDPREIERRMRYLEDCKTLLVFGTKGKPQAITFPGYWRTLKDLIGIASFQNRAALTVPMMDKCVAYAREWCETRGVVAPGLFDEKTA